MPSLNSFIQIKYLLVAIIAIFAPAESVIVTAFVLLLVDLITGTAAARKQGIPIVSSKIKITVIKALLYETVIILAFLVGQYLTGPLIPVLSIVASVIGLTELTSIMENLDIITGGNILQGLINAVKRASNSSDEDK